MADFFLQASLPALAVWPPFQAVLQVVIQDRYVCPGITEDVKPIHFQGITPTFLFDRIQLVNPD